MVTVTVNSFIVTTVTKPVDCSSMGGGGEGHCQQGKVCCAPTSLRQHGERQTALNCDSDCKYEMSLMA